MSARPERVRLEIAANSLASALAAQEGGADRVELCENLGEGGCTPSYGTLAMARERLRIPLYVLIRPRAGDFLYDTLERDTMLRDIEMCVRLGCDGVVVGALDAHGDVDAVLCRDLLAAAGSLGVTFHRAIDVARDPFAALDAAIALGCERVLTSGAHAAAPEGSRTIASFVERAAGRIGVMAGAGVTPGNVRDLVQQAGVREVHASAKQAVDSPMHLTRRLPGLDAPWSRTDAGIVRALRDALAS
ncbi:copper homeostasis protein CutC [Lysobacter auxotrophicus]|uniref:PF03932 family protein CutC n=1 Tax=Lysobacter auxotrophicus TaxID=2992573 RepID=A0ABM8DH52_9GAMM|nr:copper homeostasis protein CutC [Lysobacter auxotrophicus]BDU17944.1 thiamine phosphate synthase [Lysobacter auxotrophicus]